MRRDGQGTGTIAPNGSRSRRATADGQGCAEEPAQDGHTRPNDKPFADRPGARPSRLGGHALTDAGRPGPLSDLAGEDVAHQ